MKSIIFALTLLLSSSSFAYKLYGVRCKDLPKKSCEKKMCKCYRGFHRASKGKEIKHKRNKKGKKTISYVCSKNGASTKEEAWEKLKKARKKLREKCP